jgi:ESCRT-I complex subunit TSG101
VYYHTDGARERLLCAKGTVPIEYGGGRYNIPVTAYAPSDFPSAAPTWYVTPTREMVVKANHACVEADGEVVLERLMTWNARSSSMREAGERMAEAFSVEPPVFSKPTRTTMATATNGDAGTGSLFASSSATATSRYPEINFGADSTAFRGDGETRFAETRESPTTSPRAEDAEEAGQLFRDRIIRSLTARLRDEAEARLGVDVELVESLLSRQSALYEKKMRLRQECAAYQNLCARYERDAHELDRATTVMEDWLRKHPPRHESTAPTAATLERSPESILRPVDAVGRQILDAHVLDAAVEDTLDVLDELLNDGRVELDDYLRHVTRLCEKQFVARAEILVASRAQRDRGVVGGLQRVGSDAHRAFPRPSMI